MSAELRASINMSIDDTPTARLTKILDHLEVPTSSWYRVSDPSRERRRPGPAPKPIPVEIREAVIEMATDNPWYGYKRIAVMCRRTDVAVKNRQAYNVMRDACLLQKRRSPRIEAYQAAKLYDLLPQKPNDLWQMDVTYVHIPGHGWHYVVTVIDYYSRYLLAAYLTTSYSAVEVTHALGLAREEAERIHGELEKQPFLVTDNGSSFLARRFGEYLRDRYSHVRIRYRTPTQLGLLERFHKTLKEEEIYWRLYKDPSHARDGIAEFRERYNNRRPHWALVPEAGGDPYVPYEVYSKSETIMIPKWQAWARSAKERLDKLMDEVA
jgi:transposase InsO family protein